MENFNRYVQGFLAVAITVGFFVVIGALMSMTELPTSVKDILLVMLGALLASFKEITGYFFGSSSSSKSKDDTISESLRSTAAANTLTAASTPVPVKIDTSDEPVAVKETTS